MSDTYTLALVAYAFELADDPAKETALNELMKKVVREGENKLTLLVLDGSTLVFLGIHLQSYNLFDQCYHRRKPKLN